MEGDPDERARPRQATMSDTRTRPEGTGREGKSARSDVAVLELVHESEDEREREHRGRGPRGSGGGRVERASLQPGEQAGEAPREEGRRGQTERQRVHLRRSRPGGGPPLRGRSPRSSGADELQEGGGAHAEHPGEREETAAPRSRPPVGRAPGCRAASRRLASTVAATATRTRASPRAAPAAGARATATATGSSRLSQPSWAAASIAVASAATASAQATASGSASPSRSRSVPRTMTAVVRKRAAEPSTDRVAPPKR